MVPLLTIVPLVITVHRIIVFLPTIALGTITELSIMVLCLMAIPENKTEKLSLLQIREFLVITEPRIAVLGEIQRGGVLGAPEQTP